MVVSGVPERIINHGERIAEMAFAMLSSVVDIKDPSDTTDYIKIRIGKRTTHKIFMLTARKDDCCFHTRI